MKRHLEHFQELLLVLTEAKLVRLKVWLMNPTPSNNKKTYTKVHEFDPLVR